MVSHGSPHIRFGYFNSDCLGGSNSGRIAHNCKILPLIPIYILAKGVECPISRAWFCIASAVVQHHEPLSYTEEYWIETLLCRDCQSKRITHN